MPDIVQVASARQRRQFVELPYSLYAGHPHWVPPLRRDERRRLSPGHNAFLAHAEMDLWLATTNGRVTGRVAAIEDRRHNEAHGEAVTWFGFFEAENAETADVLLAAVERWGRARRRLTVPRPANPSLHESAGRLGDCFDGAPYLPI